MTTPMISLPPTAVGPAPVGSTPPEPGDQVAFVASLLQAAALTAPAESPADPSAADLAGAGQPPEQGGRPDDGPAAGSDDAAIAAALAALVSAPNPLPPRQIPSSVTATQAVSLSAAPATPAPPAGQPAGAQLAPAVPDAVTPQLPAEHATTTQAGTAQQPAAGVQQTAAHVSTAQPTVPQAQPSPATQPHVTVTPSPSGTPVQPAAEQLPAEAEIQAAPEVPPRPRAAHEPDLSAVLAAGSVSAPGAPAQAASASAAVVATDPAPHEQVAAALVPLRARGDGEHRLTIQLHPADLGPVTVTARIEHGTITVALSSSSGVVHETLTTALPQLRQDLQAGGFHSVAVSIGGGATGQQDTAGDRGATRQQAPASGAEASAATPAPAARRGDTALDRWL